jgi:hypothetical protein
MLVKKGSKSSPGREQGVSLPKHPSPNPAYAAWGAPDGGAVVWTYKQGKQFVGYRFNTNGRRVWRLCDSQRSPAEIATEFRSQTGRTESEAAEFLTRLLSLGIVVAGSYVVPVGNFPKATPGGWYRPRLGKEEEEGNS